METMRIRLMFDDGSTAAFDVSEVEVQTIGPVQIQGDGYGLRIKAQQPVQAECDRYSEALENVVMSGDHSEARAVAESALSVKNAVGQ